MDWEEKILPAKEAISKIQPGNRVFIGTGCGEPGHLIKAMIKDNELQDIMIYQMLGFCLSDYLDDPRFLKRFSLKLFFISRAMRQAASTGKIDYIPTYLSKIPELFLSRKIGLDVALVQVTPPDRLGFCSLGISVDITKAAIKAAGLVIAQVNRHMPRTMGDSQIHLEQIDFLVSCDEPIVESPPRQDMTDPVVSCRIGKYVAQVVEDGSTLQVGFGHLPNQILQYLDKKKDLGVHTQVITDGFLPLFKKKVITNKKKSLHPGRTVASLCMGSSELYNYVDNHAGFDFRSSDYVNDPKVIALNDQFISIGSALEVDLTGQVCSDSLGNSFYSGIGDQADFLRGAALAKGGMSIIALPSTARTRKGLVSRIVVNLSEGAGIASTRVDVDMVVTEYGIAELQGKSVYQRVMELIQVAHPDFREKLLKTAKSKKFVSADQLAPVQDDLIFLEEYKETLTFKGKHTVMFRPLLPSDEFAYRNFFYSLERETIYKRFLFEKKIFSHKTVQAHYERIDYKKNMFLIGSTVKKRHREILCIGSYMNMGKGRAEVAFVVRDDYQDLGIATYLLSTLKRIAMENGFCEFFAITLKSNKRMLSVFKKVFPDVRTIIDGSEVMVYMTFNTTQPELGQKALTIQPV